MILTGRRVNAKGRDISRCRAGRAFDGLWTLRGEGDDRLVRGADAELVGEGRDRCDLARAAAVAVVPVALLAAVVVMMLGHVVGGLALFGGSVLAAAMAVALAGVSGMRHLRKLVSESSFGFVQLDDSQYTDVAEPGGGGYTNVVQLDRSEYTEVR